MELLICLLKSLENLHDIIFKFQYGATNISDTFANDIIFPIEKSKLSKDTIITLAISLITKSKEDITKYLKLLNLVILTVIQHLIKIDQIIMT